MGRRGRGCYWLVPQSYIDKSCSYLTVANVHINNECAQRRSVCIALLLLIRDLCLKLGAVVLTSDFNKGAERELSLVAPRASAAFSREAAFSSARVPWPTLGGLRCCGDLAVNPMVTSGLSAAVSWFCRVRRRIGSS